MKLIGYYCPPPFCNRIWTLEEVCTMLEERKKEYWWEVEEEEKEYNTKLVVQHLKQPNKGNMKE